MVGTKQTSSLRQSEGFTVIEVLIIIVVLAILGLAGYYIYHKNNSVKNTATNRTSNSQTSKTSKATQSLTASAKVGDFSFAYPKTWTVFAGVNPPNIFSILSPDYQRGQNVATGADARGTEIDISSQTNYDYSSLSAYIQGNDHVNATPTSTTVAGYPALRIDSGDTVLVAFMKDNTVYSVSGLTRPLGTPNPYAKVVDDIAASFKLAN